MKKIIKILLLILILLIIIFSYLFYNSLFVGSENDETVLFTVESGASCNSVLLDMHEQDLIDNVLFSKLYLKLKTYDFKSGSFELNKNMSTIEMFEYISNGSNIINDDVRVTFIEGDWSKHYAHKLEETMNIDADEFLALWNDKDFVLGLKDKYPFISDDIFNEDSRILLEGYLFPNTYLFSKDMTKEEITYRMLDETLRVYEKYEDDFKKSDLSTHEIFTLASIVQYESGNHSDMKMIAQVFYNRLAIGMKLQSSVTVCYALDLNEDDSWTKCETNPTYNSPYNTYMYEGLPPSPILNMGEDAIDAVLHPQENDYYYFVADVYGDGSVHYAKTYDEHLANIRKFGL